jgi:hypothetical protein
LAHLSALPEDLHFKVLPVREDGAERVPHTVLTDWLQFTSHDVGYSLRQSRKSEPSLVYQRNAGYCSFVERMAVHSVSDTVFDMARSNREMGSRLICIEDSVLLFSSAVEFVHQHFSMLDSCFRCRAFVMRNSTYVDILSVYGKRFHTAEITQPAKPDQVSWPSVARWRATLRLFCC